ncbi:protein FATTY ACID EXPORT 1, chloroplastic-like [Phragmites australis]|uniref:protein FATTY ACID EXPORT 1, chloroplastic-like n=1 Tax=Phragmites australis TaxID=29695 RepID=UPI002D76C97E|nr:protein FATTY ACID EXPORT 1, chloroplastic-like [Phragmites australis]
MVMSPAQIRGSVASATARRWPAPPSARSIRFSLLAPSTVPASLLRGAFSGLAAGAVSKPLITMCMKADYTRPIDPITSAEQTGDEIQEPAIVAPANKEINIEQEVAPQQKCAKIHDFCLGIPFGGFLFSMGLIGFLFWRSPVSLTFGVAPGLAILAFGVLSLKVWRSGKSSLPFILAQAAVAAAVAWKHCQAYTTTKKLLPWGFYAALSVAMICFYSYVLIAGGNPPPKKAAAA